MAEESVPQFDSGPKVFVKNTFLDFEETPLAPPPLERVRTVPANCRYSSEPLEPSAEAPAEPADDEPEDDEPADDEEAVATGDEAEGQPAKLGREVTREWECYEPARDWEWASPQAPVSMPAASPTAAMAPVGAPVMYQGMPITPGATTMMVPMLVPVGAPTAGYAPNTALPVMDPGAMAAVAVAGTSPSQMGGASPVSPSMATSDGSGKPSFPPPPPTMAPTIERVASGGMAAPTISPDHKKLGSLLESMKAFEPSDGADAGAPPAAGPPAAVEPVKSPTASAPQPQTLMRTFSMGSGYFRVHWTVDARKLKGNDKQAVSPPFELSFGRENVIFKMMIYPKATNDSKGGASFKKAKGRGYVQLKCEAEIAEGVAQIKFRIGIGEGESAQGPRGPQLHNFSQSAVCGLEKAQEEWNFEEVVDKDSQTFRVTLEIVPAAGG